MKVKACYFAMLRDAVGKSEEWVELPPGSTPEALRTRLRETSPRSIGLLASLAVAVNLSYGGWDKPLNEGDEVALLPPVAGG